MFVYMRVVWKQLFRKLIRSIFYSRKEKYFFQFQLIELRIKKLIPTNWFFDEENIKKR